MLGKVTSCAVVGLDAALIEVEVDVGRGLPSITIVGLPDPTGRLRTTAVAVMARKQGYRTLYVPEDDAAEASLIDGLDVYPVPNLLALWWITSPAMPG